MIIKKYEIKTVSQINYKRTHEVDPIVYLIVSAGKVSLRELYYEYDFEDIIDMLEIILCDSYNQWLRNENIKNEMQVKKGR